MRVAIVHDWLTGMRGGERCLEVFCELFPEADIFTLVHLPDKISASIEGHSIRESWIGSLPGARRRHQAYLALFPSAMEGFDLRGYDLVLSSSHCVAKGVRVPEGVPHLCYIYTPMRYAYEFYEVYRDAISNPVARWIFGLSLRWIRRWDQASKGRPTAYCAISETVRDRVLRHYGRNSDVVYPPVDELFFHPSGEAPSERYVVLSALVPYKRIDLAIEAFRLLGHPLVVVGDGSQRPELEARAPSNVRFLGRISDEEVRRELQGARAMIFPGEEDFGITPLEANACGRPVVAYRRGGATETLVDGETGCFFDEQSPEALAEAVEASRSMAWDPERCRSNARRFGRKRFAEEMRSWIEARSGLKLSGAAAE